jgi:hypothetical protein
MARRKRTAKKKPLSTGGKVLIYGGLAVGGWYIWTRLLKPMFAPSEPGTEEPDAGTDTGSGGGNGGGGSQSGGALTAAGEYAAQQAVGMQGGAGINAYKQVGPGTKNDETLAAIKTAFNSIYYMAVKQKQSNYLGWNMQQAATNSIPTFTKEYVESRTESIINIFKKYAPKGLDTKTEYGDPTKKVAAVLMGDLYFNYNDVRNRKKALWAMWGAGNPY